MCRKNSPGTGNPPRNPSLTELTTGAARGGATKLGGTEMSVGERRKMTVLGGEWQSKAGERRRKTYDGLRLSSALEAPGATD